MAAVASKGSIQPNRSGSRFGGKKRKKFDLKQKFGVKRGRLEIEAEEISKLEQGIAKFKPSQVKTFADFPLSEKTLKGLEFAKYTVPTTIQRECIGLALQGNDIVAAAKTGSGKTLAFLIPMLEKLYRQGWKRFDGLGALIISPTRELVDQTFAVLNKVGKFHQFAGGVVFGGKDKKGKRKDGTKRYLKTITVKFSTSERSKEPLPFAVIIFYDMPRKCREEEARTIHGMNIVVGTPGRLRELMDSSAEFRTENLQILILDEADQCLELGFKNDLDAIMDWLPHSRQTLLFSATQTSAKLDLLRVNLKQPVCVSAHGKAEHSTPTSLQQSYVICEQHDKLDLLWSFIRSHLKKKVLVFLATCKQVRFVYESFCKLRPGVPLLALHGAMKQSKRTEMYDAFCRKQSVVLIATDVAARGLGRDSSV